MFAKVFSQIFDSSIAMDHVVRHVFMDLLVLADRDGVVDMTQDAIARRTNVPLEIIEDALRRLGEPDTRSRSGDEDGRRIVPIDSRRDWGWQIVNYQHYRDLRDEESRRAYFRDKKREQRERDKSKFVPHRSRRVKSVKDSPHLSTKAEADVDIEKPSANGKPSQATKHAEFKSLIAAYWKSKNTIEMPWDGGEGKALRMFMGANPSMTAETFHQCLRNRYQSDVNHAERPRAWLANVTSYAAGPLDKFGKPKQATPFTPSSTRYAPPEVH